MLSAPVCFFGVITIRFALVQTPELANQEQTRTRNRITHFGLTNRQCILHSFYRMTDRRCGHPLYLFRNINDFIFCSGVESRDSYHRTGIVQLINYLPLSLCPMGKNFQNRHMTVTFFMRSVPILTPAGVKNVNFTTILKILYDSVIRQL